jgi:ATP-binding cassette subfamily B protein
LKVIQSKTQFDIKKAVQKKPIIAILQLIKGYYFKYIVATLGVGISAISKTATYFLLSYFVDDYLTLGNRSINIWWIASGFIILAILQGGFSFLSGRLAAETAEGSTKRLRDYIFDHIQHLPFDYHDKTQTGELLQRATSDVDAIRRFYADQAISFGRIVMLFLINFIAMLNINAQLAWYSVIAIPFVVLVSVFFFKKVSKAYEAVQEQDAVLQTTLQENLSGVRVVKAFARQPYEMAKFDKENREKFQRGKKLLSIHSLFWPISDVICGIQMIAGYAIGATMAINGTISTGEYLAYAGMIIWIIFPMRNLGRLIVQMSTGLVSYGRIAEIIKEDREPLDEGNEIPVENLEGKITFSDVSFEYEQDKAVISNIDFTCEPGQVVALLGATGSGKTTLVNLLPRFYEYTGGKIMLDSTELKDLSRRFLRRNIGIVEQEPFLFSRTIRENISYGIGRDVSQEDIEKAARAAAIHEVIESFPKGYDTLVGEKGVTLSGGQKQRVTIARTLLKNPKILILDDSTSSVDLETESEIRDALQNLMKNRTTFIIAHRIQSIMNADIILVLKDGKIVQRGKHAELAAQNGIYKEIFELQTSIEAELEKEISSVN